MLRGLSARLGRQLLPNFSALESTGTRGLKETTGIVGLEVVPDARSVLREKCQEVLKAIQSIPEDTEYRRSVESTMNFRCRVFWRSNMTTALIGGSLRGACELSSRALMRLKVV